MDVVDGMDEVVVATGFVDDPMDHDEVDDQVVVTTRRGLTRIAFVAAETASRFEREGIGHDPVAWMMTPRKIFDGSAAIDACLERHPFLRAAILHGLSWGLDALPEQIDPLIDDDELEEFETDHVEAAFMQAGCSGHRGRMGMISTGSVGLAIPHYNTPVYRAVPRRTTFRHSGTDAGARTTQRATTNGEATGRAREVGRRGVRR